MITNSQTQIIISRSGNSYFYSRSTDGKLENETTISRAEAHRIIVNNGFGGRLTDGKLDFAPGENKSFTWKLNYDN